MMRKFLMGLLACGLVWIGAGAIASAHEDDWGGAVAGGPEGHAPLDISGLEPYGEWLWEPAHGRVWKPYVEADWRPYWRGHWAWHGGWVWVSADPWGDGPFHYGEWTWSHRLGWVWVPGVIWAPARVTWIVDGPMIAWAPAGLHITFGSDPRFWVYADRDHFDRHVVVRPHRLPPPHRHVHRGAVIRDVDRVVAPHRPPKRAFRSDPPRERAHTVSAERRVSAPRDDRANRRFTVESPRESRRSAGAGRGFERRGDR